MWYRYQGPTNQALLHVCILIHRLKLHFYQPQFRHILQKVNTVGVIQISRTDKSYIATCLYTHTQTITTFLQPTVPTDSTESRNTEGDTDTRDRQIRQKTCGETHTQTITTFLQPTIPTDSTESKYIGCDTDIRDRQIRHCYMSVYSYTDYNYISTTDSSEEVYTK